MAILIGTIAGGLFVAGASHMGWICAGRDRIVAAVLGVRRAHSGDASHPRLSCPSPPIPGPPPFVC